MNGEVPITQSEKEGVCKYALPGREIEHGGNRAVDELTGLPAPIETVFLYEDQSLNLVFPFGPSPRRYKTHEERFAYTGGIPITSFMIYPPKYM